MLRLYTVDHKGYVERTQVLDITCKSKFHANGTCRHYKRRSVVKSQQHVVITVKL